MSFLKKVADLIKVQGAQLPDLEEEILKNAGSYEKAISIWASWLVHDLQILSDSTQTMFSVADVQPFNIRQKREHILEKCERFAERADYVLSNRTRQYAEIANLYLSSNLSIADKQKREDAALNLQNKFTSSIATINKLAAELINEGKDVGLHEKHPSLFSYLQNLGKMTWVSMVSGFKKGDVPFRYKD